MMIVIVIALIIAAVLFIGWRYRMLLQMIAMLIVIAILVAVIGYLKYQGYQGFMAFKEGMSKAKQTIATATATSEDWTSELQAVGSLRAAKGVDISNELAGTVEEIHFHSGDDVKAGSLMLTLRAEDDIAKLHSLEAMAKIARITYERDKKQFKVEAISKATLDNDEANLSSAVAQAEQQKALVEKKSIRAPFSGHLGIRNVDLGQYLNAGTAIVTLQELDPIYLDFYLPQQDLAHIKEGQKIIIKNDTYPGRPFEGKITAINPKVDPATRNIQVRGALTNTDHALLPGMYATADISVGNPQKFVTLPQTAITYNPYGDTVFIVHHKDELQQKDDKKDADKKNTDKDKDATPKDTTTNPAPAPKDRAPITDKSDDLVVEQIFVTLGETRGDQVQILKGVNEGDVVVSAGQLKLQNGAAITINNTVTPKNDAAPAPKDQ